ncbi:hypothetical protein RUM44_007513 [Polyplax serrata]|uniref:E3 ubiquitin-protein ligase Hakai n=1 Tax=Polyplax serrata TaxID=468196 RepID=A0ABR1B0V5_POLSC
MDSMRGRARGRRPRTRARGRPKKNIDHKQEATPVHEDEHQVLSPSKELHSDNQALQKIDMEADISQLEAPTFTTINRGPPEAMLRLRWGHPVNLLGEKVLNPMIHCCDVCLHPVLIYGRMIPCKHVFCLSCAKAQSTECPRCKEKLLRVEETSLGSLFMCTHGGSRYGNNGCGRTYLSERDLQAHINHRHVSAQQGDDHINTQFPMHGAQKVGDIQNKSDMRPQGSNPTSFYENEKPKIFDEAECLNYPSVRNRDSGNTLSRSSNLITVPLQGQSQDPYYLGYNASGYYASSYHEYTPPAPSQTDVSVSSHQPWTSNQQFYG